MASGIDAANAWMRVQTDCGGWREVTGVLLGGVDPEITQLRT